MTDRRRSALLGVFFGYANLAISLARNVLLVPIYLRTIPLPEYGAWLATGGALALILINDYGLSGVITQRISARYGAGDFGVLGQLAGSALAIGCLLSIVLSAISLVFIPYLPGLRTLSAEQSHTVVICFTYAIAANGLGVLGATAASVIRSLQRPIFTGSIVLAAEVLNVLVILIGLAAGYGLYAIAAGVLLRSLVMALVGLFAVWICARQLKISIEIKPAAIRDLIGESSRFFLSSIAIKLLSQANVFFVGAILGPASAAIYSLTVRAHDTVVMLIILINGSLVPSVTHLYGSGNIARFRIVVLRLVEIVAALTALAMTVTVILNPAFLHVWVGKEAFGGQGVSILMAIALFVSVIGGVAYDALLAQGNFRFVTRVYLVSSILQIALLVTLVRWGLWAAPLVTLIIGVVWGGAFWTNIARNIKVTSDEVRRLLVELARLVTFSVICAAAFTLFYPAANSWPALVLEGLICGTCLAAAYFAISRSLREKVLEEIGVTWRSFRAT